MPACYGEYRKAFHELVRKARAKGIRVVFVEDDTTKDFAGMNTAAGETMGLKLPEKTIWIDNNLGWKAAYHTLKHELIEMPLMENGSSYWQAHLVALRGEK